MAEPEVIEATAAAVETKSLALIEAQGVDTIVLRADPQQVLADARKAATALMQVINAKDHKVMMNGEQYIENEDWQFIARFYGLAPQLESERFVQYGEAQGFEATCIAVDVKGNVRGRASAMCLNDEEKWSSRTKYAYAYVLKTGEQVIEEPADVFKVCVLEPTGKSRPDGSPVMRPKKVRVEAGTESVPLFQLRSMAQTRASSKVLASLLRFVPLLANLKGTPAEELEGQVERVAREKPAETKQPPAETKKAAEKPAETKPNGKPSNRPITDGQQKRLFARMGARAKALGIEPKDLRMVVRDHIVALFSEKAIKFDAEQDLAGQIPESVYDEIVAWVDGYKVQADPAQPGMYEREPGQEG